MHMYDHCRRQRESGKGTCSRKNGSGHHQEVDVIGTKRRGQLRTSSRTMPSGSRGGKHKSKSKKNNENNKISNNDNNNDSSNMARKAW